MTLDAHRWMKISKMKRKFQEDYAFVPRTFLLSCEWERFVNALEEKQKRGKKKCLWILKPVASACGRGIKLLNKKCKIQNKKNYLASEYIHNPHLIDGYKYDLRLYILISSYDPLRVYLYSDGLARFATEKYTIKAKSLQQKFIHLTNYTVNKKSNNFVTNKSANQENQGSKWSLKALLQKYQELKIDVDKLFGKIHDLIIKTCISVEPFMLRSINKTSEHRNNCFELYGFDVLIDDNINPW